MIFEAVSICPICSSEQFKPLLVTRDYSISKTDFTLQECSTCKFVITSPRPDYNTISLYYQSTNYISHTSKGNNLIDRLYLIARAYTLRWKYRIIRKHKPGGFILDFGCGTGAFLQYMKKRNWIIAGIEPSETAREQACTNTGTNIFSTLSQVEKQFDVITLWHVLEHVHDLNKKIQDLKSHLEKDGILLIAVPNHNSLDSKKYGSYWAGYDVPRHLWHFSKQDMTKLLAKEGFEIMDTVPMKLDSLYVSLLSEGYKHPKESSLIRFIKGILAGIKSNLAARGTGQYSSIIYIAKQV
jgi:SAM-dependent methyltransferase